MSIINRHRAKGDWTAGSELQATHGAILREIPETLSCRTRHGEVILIVAAINSTTKFVTSLCRVDDEHEDACLIEPVGLPPGLFPEAGEEDSSSEDDDSFPKTSRTPPRPPLYYVDEAEDVAREPLLPPPATPAVRGVDGADNPFRIGAGADAAPVDETAPVPFGTLGLGYAAVGAIRPLPDHVHLTPAHHPGAGREQQVVRQAVSLECYDALKKDGGLSAGSAMLQEKETHPQFMTIGSRVVERELPHVAGVGPEIERAAIANRHFAEKVNEYGGLTGVVQESALPAIAGAADSVLQLLLKAGRCAREFQQFPEGYDAHAKDASDSLHKKSTLLADFEYFAYVPRSWSKQRGKTGLAKMTNTEEDVRQKHTFFVKLNEALQKIKPRLIQASGDEGAIVHTFDAGLLESIMFGITILERRSVKHAGPEHLRARLAGLLRPYMSGYAISYDYGAFDSSNCMHRDDPRHSLKNSIENQILKRMFGGDAKMSDQSRLALEDRCRTFLRSRSAFWLLYTKTYGRESGDRGTSCLNFLVNLILWLAIMGMESAYRKTCKLHKWAAEPVAGDHPSINAFVHGMQYDSEIVERFLRGEPCGFDLVAEGDDGLWLFTKKFADESPGGISAMADRFHYWSCMQGTNLEPQDETGEAQGINRVQPVWRRMEHCSRVIVPYWTEVTERKLNTAKGASRPAAEGGEVEEKIKQRCVLRVALLPKMRKTIEASDITFGLAPGVELDVARMKNIAFTKFASCAFNSLDDPFLFNYFFMHARVQLFGDGDPDLDKHKHDPVEARFEYSAQNYVHKTMAHEMSGKTSTLDEDATEDFPVGPFKLLQMLQQRHERAIAFDGHCEAIRRAISLESPCLDEEFILAAVSGMKQTGTWTQCGEWAGRIKARLGYV